MDIIDIIASYGGWSWIVAGLVLLGLELIVPGGFLLWLGIAGVITGIAALIQPIDGPLQWGLFGVVAVVSILTWLKFFKSRPAVNDRPYLNRRADRFIGHEALLDEPITAGFGRVTLGDTVWRVAGQDMDAGRRVRIVGADGAVLKVEAL